ncbi:O-antigen ligase family protein [Erysipelothrix rhusiopathiae]|uniref:O-antigen ligase family protein n=1 Tax=Erysipelothrix rhusiopathiae TaxID=1648 RepID=UPI002B2543CF|nr:O-antigen ligase family protein [Erysipelothrix rhusiopathiae]WRB93464.1 O-antigen ligase family protein [Erysipelothrix rhusiopathiae]
MLEKLLSSKESKIALFYSVTYFFTILGFNQNYSYLVFLLGIAFFKYAIFNYKQEGGYENIIFHLLIYSVPLSFVNVMGSRTKPLFLTWFNLLLIVLIFYLFVSFALKINSIDFKKYPKNQKGFLVSSLIFLIGISCVILSLPNFISAASQAYYLVLFVVLVALFVLNTPFLSFNVNSLKKSYRITAVSTACFLVIQVFLFYAFNKEVGFHLRFIRSATDYRDAFAVVFADFSFLSLFLSSAIPLVWKNKRSITYRISSALILLLASFLTSARTGLFCFVVVLAVIFYVEILKGNKISRKQKIYFSLILVAVGIALVGLLTLWRGNKLFDDSGRFDLMYKAVTLFKSNVLLGIGFGMKQYPGVIPHNIFFQYLAQGGLFLILPLLYYIYQSYFILFNQKNNIDLKYALMIILVGSQLIGNIVDSRFLLVIIMLILVGNENKWEIKKDE